MPRRHLPPESVHAQRWMVSYADFMTLMFAFFVVLYAASSINDDKFEQMSQMFVGVFEQPAAMNLPQDIQSLISDLQESLQLEQTAEKAEMSDESVVLQQQLTELLKTSLNQPRVNLRQLPNYWQIELPADYIFIGKSATISPEGAYLLSKMADVFELIPNFINVEVFTDNQVLESNPWRLAGQQGMAILQLLVLDDVSPLRLAAVNYGPFQPIATNDDEDGQSINRRVLFLIHETRESVDRIQTVTDEHLSANPKQ